MDSVTRAAATQTATAGSMAASPSGPASASPSVATVSGAGSSLSGIDTVETSGRAIMISRLFYAVPESVFATPDDGATSGLTYSFLTSEDRATIAGLYDTSRDNGYDLRNVDAVAFDLAIYRSSRPGVDHAMPVRYDASGTIPRPAAFSPQDEAAAQRLLTSKALTSSALPVDFLRARLDPAQSEGHASDLSFLEQLVYATSPQGAAHDPDARVPPRPRDYFADALAAIGSTAIAEIPAGAGTAKGLASMGTAEQVMLALSSKHLDSLSAIVAQWYSGSKSRHTPYLPRLSESLMSTRRLDS